MKKTTIIRDLIINNKMENAFTLLLKQYSDNQKISLFHNQWKALEEEYGIGLVTNNEHNVRRSKIVFSLLKLVDDLSKLELNDKMLFDVSRLNDEQLLYILERFCMEYFQTEIVHIPIVKTRKSNIDFIGIQEILSLVAQSSPVYEHY